VATASDTLHLPACAPRSYPPTSSSFVDEKRVDSLLLSSAARDTDARRRSAGFRIPLRSADSGRWLSSADYVEPVTTPPRETYSHGHHESVLRSHRWRTAANSAGYLLPLLKPTDRLLDIGVGPGTITADLATRLTAGSVLGIDNARAAVAAAEQLAQERGLANLTVITGNVYDLDLPDNQFDVVHAHQVLQHLSDPVAALREMRRVCTAEGIVAVRDADYSAMTWFPDHPGMTRWLELYLQVARRNGGEPDAGRRLRHWAILAGFSSVASTASAWCYAEAEDLAWWSATWAERLVASPFGRRAVEFGLASDDELTILADAWREWAAAPGAWFAVLHGELICRPPKELPSNEMAIR
jgi:SAM-dependent methyltransferase